MKIWDILRSPKKSTIKIILKAIFSATQHRLQYLNSKTTEPLMNGSDCWDKPNLESYLLKKYSDEKTFTFHRCDTLRFSKEVAPFFILPGHQLSEEELWTLIGPIVGTAKEIFIETLPNDKKATEYNHLRESRLWADAVSERSRNESAGIQLLAGPPQSTSEDREEGFSPISKDRFDELSQVYIPPAQFDGLLHILNSTRVVAIVGQPHVGKTSTALMLAQNLSLTTGIGHIYEADILDFKEPPSISQSIIIFDDLFGDFEFESIGKRIKYISQLRNQGNYLIITSRDYIFREAEDNTKITEEIPQLASEIIQEGSYSTEQLVKILNNHLQIAKAEGRIKPEVETLVQTQSAHILNELRFPHNIKMFVVNCGAIQNPKTDLRMTIESSKKVSDFVFTLVERASENEQKVLMLCALFREIKVHQVQHLVSVIGMPEDFFYRIVKENHRLMTLDLGERIRFNHPSFRQAILSLIEQDKIPLSSSLVYQLLEGVDHSIVRINSLNQTILRITRELEAPQLADLFLSKDISTDLNSIIFSSLIFKDPRLAVYTFVQAPEKKHAMKSPRNFTTHKSMENAFGIIVEDFASGDLPISKPLKRLIHLLLIASHEKTVEFYQLLSIRNAKQAKFKISLLISISHINPGFAFAEIKEILQQNLSGRLKIKLYGVLMGFDEKFIPQIIRLIEDIKQKEENPAVQSKLAEVINALTRKIRNAENE